MNAARWVDNLCRTLPAFAAFGVFVDSIDELGHHVAGAQWNRTELN